jgi:hypothetical protein
MGSDEISTTIIYNIYRKDLTNISYKFNELIYLCNNFDIKRINLLLINIIENYEFYTDEGYSDMLDANELSENIITSTEYVNMEYYINKNFENIYKKYKDYIKELKNSIYKYIDDIDTFNIFIIDNFKNEYKELISNLEEFKINSKELFDFSNNKDTKDSIKINVQLITNKIFFYEIRYRIFKNLLSKNLHVINKVDSNVTNSDEVDFKNNIYNIYFNVYNNCINSLIKEEKYIQCKEEFNENLSIKIKLFKTALKNAEIKSEQKLAKIKLNEAKKKKIEEEEAENERGIDEDILEQAKLDLNKERKILIDYKNKLLQFEEKEKNNGEQNNENSQTVSGSYFGKKDEDKEDNEDNEDNEEDVKEDEDNKIVENAVSPGDAADITQEHQQHHQEKHQQHHQTQQHKIPLYRPSIVN